MNDITEPRRHFPGRTRRLPARYDRDLYSWAVQQAALLRAGRLIEADAGNIAEELDDVGSEQYNNLRGGHAAGGQVLPLDAIRSAGCFARTRG
jgi:hypothetical protein